MLSIRLAGRAGGWMGSLLSDVAVRACPAGMGLMMWLMMRGQRGNQPGANDGSDVTARQVALLRAEIEQLKAERVRTSRQDVGDPR
jgi:hypothetical protein